MNQKSERENTVKIEMKCRLNNERPLFQILELFSMLKTMLLTSYIADRERTNIG